MRPTLVRRLKLHRRIDGLVGMLVGALFALLRRTDPARASDLCGALARRIGPWLPVHRVGQANLRAAFPEADAAWIETTLRGAWDNLGRVCGEYVHLGTIWDYDPEHPNAGRVETADAQRLIDLRDDGLPALCFAAHLGNWEMPAVAAHAHGLATAVLYRMPNNRAVAQRIARIREGLMGHLIRTRNEAAFEMAASLDRGEHLGMLVDQHWSRGVEVTFFGRPCRANPTLARLVRQHECPVVGVRVIRLPNHRFRIAATAPLDLPRDAEGAVDVKETTQMITTIIEGWVREHPEQWLWFHRRWR
jgi:KDO2-lipid IV(A) lauroyltransferase